MLGLPVSMWSPVEESDASENVDFSIPPTIPQLSLETRPTSTEMTQQNIQAPLLLITVFRPPESLQQPLPVNSI